MSQALPTASWKAPLWTKSLISVMLVLHLAAVFTAPFAFASNAGEGSRSPLASALASAMRPYITALFLEHGYFFFAPLVGPNHLVDYRVEFDDGRPPVESRFPDLAKERPRLLYHRYFMLAEALNNSYVPPEPPTEPSPPPLTASEEEQAQHKSRREAYQETLAAWRAARNQYEAMRTSIERHLKHQYGGDRVTITRIEHRPAMPDEFQVLHRRLNDAASYSKMPETTPRGDAR